jgi:hypothetical protein
MSDSILISIAKAIVAELNAPAPIAARTYTFTAFSQSFTAERIYDTERLLEQNETLRVDVVLGDITQEVSSRSSQSGEYRIDIAFRQVIDTTSIAILDALGSLVEEVDDYFFHRKSLLNYPMATWKQANVVYPYLPKEVRSNSQFISILRLTYRVVK